MIISCVLQLLQPMQRTAKHILGERQYQKKYIVFPGTSMSFIDLNVTLYENGQIKNIIGVTPPPSLF